MDINQQIKFRVSDIDTLFTGRIIRIDATEFKGRKINPDDLPCVIVKCNHGFNWVVPVAKVVA